MDIFKLEDIILPKEITQKEREQRESPGAKIPFNEVLRPPTDRGIHLPAAEIQKGSLGEDSLSLSIEGKTAYQIAMLKLSVLKTPDIREKKVGVAKEQLDRHKWLLPEVLDTIAERLYRKFTSTRIR